MRDLLIVNDAHLGTQRSAGTTPATAAQLKAYLFQSFEALILDHLDKDLLILGDLFDKFSEDDSTIEATFAILLRWLRGAEGGRLHLIPGNHDFSAKADKLSSFHLLASVLHRTFPDRVRVYDPTLAQVRESIWTIPHCLNQDLFDMELEKALVQCGAGDTLLLHANCMNHFAEQADHSLNVSEQMARDLAAKKIQLVFAHEHQSRCIEFRDQSVRQSSDFNANAHAIVLGNQFPSSVADCLAHGRAQLNGRKFAHCITSQGAFTRIPTWEAGGDYVALDWQELGSYDGQKFVRVTGDVPQAQSSEVVTTIAKFRSRCPALVITNAVRVAGIASMEDFDGVSLEDIKAFNVREALLELFDPAERHVLEQVLDESVVHVSRPAAGPSPTEPEVIEEPALADIETL